jgi:hypothetical protein
MRVGLVGPSADHTKDHNSLLGLSPACALKRSTYRSTSTCTVEGKECACHRSVQRQRLTRFHSKCETVFWATTVGVSVSVRAAHLGPARPVAKSRCAALMLTDTSTAVVSGSSMSSEWHIYGLACLRCSQFWSNIFFGASGSLAVCQSWLCRQGAWDSCVFCRLRLSGRMAWGCVSLVFALIACTCRLPGTIRAVLKTLVWHNMLLGSALHRSVQRQQQPIGLQATCNSLLLFHVYVLLRLCHM